MNKLLYPLLAMCLTASASLLLAQNAAAADGMDQGTMTMQKKDAMDNGAMMEKDAMKQDSMGQGMMQQDTMRQKTHARKKAHKQDKMMDDKMQPMK
jgi:hypothetical protein